MLGYPSITKTDKTTIGQEFKVGTGLELRNKKDKHQQEQLTSASATQAPPMGQGG
jgi:hypothetical protein